LSCPPHQEGVLKPQRAVKVHGHSLAKPAPSQKPSESHCSCTALAPSPPAVCLNDPFTYLQLTNRSAGARFRSLAGEEIKWGTLAKSDMAFALK